MRQQVNLLNPDLLTVKEKLDARAMLLIVIASTALLGLISMWSKSQLTKQKEQQQTLASTLESTKKHYDAVLEKHAERPPSESLKAELKAAEAKLQDRQRVLEFIKHRTIEHSEGLSRYMTALSNRSMKGVWITSFNIDQSDETIEINGRALQPQLVAEYINNLGQESVFKGRNFASFESKGIPLENKNSPSKSTSNATIIGEFTLKSPKKNATLPEKDGMKP